jgi:hypothetical protein
VWVCLFSALNFLRFVLGWFFWMGYFLFWVYLWCGWGVGDVMLSVVLSYVNLEVVWGCRRIKYLRQKADFSPFLLEATADLKDQRIMI